MSRTKEVGKLIGVKDELSVGGQADKFDAFVSGPVGVIVRRRAMSVERRDDQPAHRVEHLQHPVHCQSSVLGHIQQTATGRLKRPQNTPGRDRTATATT